VPTHFIRRLNMRETADSRSRDRAAGGGGAERAAGSLSQRLGIEEGTQLPRSIIEFYYKERPAQRPHGVGRAHHRVRLATPQEIDDIMALADSRPIPDGLFPGHRIRLSDFKWKAGVF